MPNIKSAIKRVKVTETKRLRNQMNKTRLKTALKKFDQAVQADPKAVSISVVVSSIDKAVTKGVIHRNAANRKKSRLAKRLNKAAAQA